MKRTLIVLVLTIAAYSPSEAQDESCSAVMSTSASSITFLEEQKDTGQSPCISSVIKHLGKAQDVAAVHILVSYLDFVDPTTLPRADGFSDVRPEYPSVDALFLIGKPATRKLLASIQAGESPKIRQNAVRTYQAVYRDDLASGIRLLKREERVAASSEARRRLREATELLIDDCSGRSEPEAQRCKSLAGR